MRQLTSPDLKRLARDYGATTIPDRDEFIEFEGDFNDDDFARAYPLLKSYGVGHLSLRRCPVSDLSVSLLVQLDRVQDLNLAGTEITLDGLCRLKLSKQLRRLVVEEGRFTPTEIERLRACLPGVEICETEVF